MRLGIARALILAFPDDRPPLKKAGFLTRDPRATERKKYGLKKAGPRSTASAEAVASGRNAGIWYSVRGVSAQQLRTVWSTKDMGK